MLHNQPKYKYTLGEAGKMSDNLYFEPPSRLQLIDKLAHLLRFSNTILVLAGPSGSGVSTVVEQLHNQAVEDDVYILSLTLEANTNLNALLKMLNSAMDELVNPHEEEALDELSLLHQKIETLASLQRKLLISIDSSDYLSDEATESLVNLLAANQGKIAITLAGSEQLVGKVSTLVAAENLTQNLHVEILSPFNRLETEEFIQLRFLRGNDFSNKQLSDIYLNSEGYPGRITLMTSEMIKSGKIKLNGKGNLLPIPHIIGIAVLLIGITAVLFWQSVADDGDLIAQESEDRASQTLELDLPGEDALTEIQERVKPAQFSSQASEVTGEVESLENEIASLSNKIEAQRALIESAKEDSQLTDLTDNLESTAEPLSIDSDTQSPQIATDLASNEVDNSAVTADIEPIGQNEKVNVDNTLQVNRTVVPVETVSAAEEVSALKKATLAAVKKVTADSVVVVKKTVSGEQESTTATTLNIEEQLNSLSAVLKKNIDPALLQEEPVAVNSEIKRLEKANILPTTSVQQGVIIKESSISDAKIALKNPIPIANEVTVTTKNTAVVKRQIRALDNTANAKQWRADSTIRNWPNTGYTLQLISAKSEAGVVKFLKTMPNAEKMYYFKNKAWNVVIYGQFPSRNAATAAIAKLPKQLQQLKPWPKSIKSVKNSIN
ncbi:MAG: DamX protein [Oceanospirillaceae bacterium]|jgi:DamX protein